MSCSKEHSINNTGNFELLCSLKFEGTIPFSMYRSVNTGITVCIAEVDGPIINGSFNIVTETFDNDGLPYTLTFLIFAGSEECPYYNNLYFWAKRSFGNNITGNSFKDRTVFTINAAGSEAFLSLMPIYLDHILYPSLKDSAYILDVHHITSKGNSGRIYCSTQHVERTSSYHIENEMFRALYPENCGYTSILPGTTKNLRESTNNDKVKQFHEKFYRPENLTILITGKIQHDKIFQALLPLEQKIMLQKRKDIFKRPWQTPFKQLKESVDVDVAFPISHEINGEVRVAWRGPSSITQPYHYLGCLLLLQYLTQTSNLLTQYFVDQNKISSSIEYCSLRLSDSVSYIIFKKVTVEKIDLITTKSVHKLLSDLYTDGINMEKMKTVIHRFILNNQLVLEENPHKKIASVVFDHIIYGNDNNLDHSFNTIRDLEKLKNESEEYFLNLFKIYFVDAPMVVVKGKPSRAEYLKLQEEEKHIAEQITKMSRNCLEEKENELQQALRKYCKSLPYEFLAKVPIPGIDCITFYDSKRYNTETPEQHPELDVKKLPLFTYLDHVNTNFIYLQIIMDTSCISTEDRIYIPLLNEIIKNSPVKRGDHLISYEEIKALLEADTIKVASYSGINTAPNYSYCKSLIVQVELQNYEKGVQWCKELLCDTKLTAERLKIVITQELDKHEKIKEQDQMQGEILVQCLMDIWLYKKNSNRFTCNIIRQHKFFNDIMNRLNNDEEQNNVIAKIESVRKILTSPKNMFVYMALNVDKLTEQVSNVYAPWNKYFIDFVTLEKTKPNITADWKLLQPFNRFIYNGSILGLEYINSTFFIQTCSCINDIRHSDFAALCVCIKYFAQPEGPIGKVGLNKKINFRFNVLPDDGILRIAIYHTHILSAYEDFKLIVEKHVIKTKWNQYLYESAKSLAILEWINEVKTIDRMINLSMKCYCNNMSYDDYIHQTIERMSAVTMDDLIRVIALYIKPLFDPKKSQIVIVCNSSKIAEIKDAFYTMNFILRVYKSLEDLNAYVTKVIDKQSL